MSLTTGQVDPQEAQQLELELRGFEDSFSNYLMIRDVVRLTRIRDGRVRYAITDAKLRPLEGHKRGDRWFIHRSQALAWAAIISQMEASRWQSNADRLGRVIKRDEAKTRRQQEAEQKEQRRKEREQARFERERELERTRPEREEKERLRRERREKEAQLEGQRLERRRDAQHRQNETIEVAANARTPGRWPPVPEGRRYYGYVEAAAVIGTTVYTLTFYTARNQKLADCERWTDPRDPRRCVLDADRIDQFAAAKKAGGGHPAPNRTQEIPKLSIVRRESEVA